MLYFDPENPNKYAALKKELVPHSLMYNSETAYEKKKFGKGLRYGLKLASRVKKPSNSQNYL